MVKVGGEVDSFCTKCEMTLAHTVIAMVEGKPVKVECNTCHGVHRFRGNSPGAPPPGATRSTTSRPTRERVTVSFDEVLREKNLAGARRYSSHTSYQLHDVIEHPTFGLGWVSAVRDAGKVEVTFRTDVKVLIHGKA